MRLFLLAFALSSLVTALSGVCVAQDQDPFVSGEQPMRASRFEPSPAQAYLMDRARQESAHRAAILHRYDAIGFNYGQPEINGSVNFTAIPPLRHRRFVFVPSYHPFGMNNY
jgi:hypothetical protein